MGSGSWSKKNFEDYVKTSYGVTADSISFLNMGTQETFKNRRLDPVLDPYQVIRECRDSEEHPNTLPVILALDVTGSMGTAATRVAKELNTIMESIYDNEDIKDVEFCVMGIGDLTYDDAPIQMSQFESDIRIAEQLDKIYFESGGGGNDSESYTAAWYMGLNHCKLDCWNRGKKGIIITLGDELPNPYLPGHRLHAILGDSAQDINTKDLLPLAKEKFNIYHISVDDHSSSYEWYVKSGKNIDKKWCDLLGEDNYFVSNVNTLAMTITNIITSNKDNSKNKNTEVSW